MCPNDINEAVLYSQAQKHNTISINRKEQNNTGCPNWATLLNCYYAMQSKFITWLPVAANVKTYREHQDNVWLVFSVSVSITFFWLEYSPTAGMARWKIWPWRSRVLTIRTRMHEIIELIRKHPKMRRILRCESPYFHHWFFACLLYSSSVILQCLDAAGDRNGIQPVKLLPQQFPRVYFWERPSL